MRLVGTDDRVRYYETVWGASPGVSPSATHLTATANAYDAVAVQYAELVHGVLATMPLDRAFLDAFADTVLANGAGKVAELGCGPGYVAAHLADRGLDVFGVDLSPTMVDIARATYPGVRFDVGSMDALDLPAGALGGIVCWYSTIHAPPAVLPSYLAEFRRLLTPGGHLALAFFESEGGPLASFDHKVVEAYRWPVDEVAGLAGEAGFVEVGRMLREPVEDERFRRGHLLLRRH
ncbi:class I SAM-dependent methyltransferase [Streptomyces sp. NPDC047315]|uniref:class I SAM-dependent DNA methyltransferase n=1 Tax=Streptomyces sp. NPDC047315 TaxID=3155142 RepID=UPI0033D631C2